MKKLLLAFMCLGLIFSLVGCGASPATPSEAPVSEDPGYSEGIMGDVMSSEFFDFTVNSAETLPVYEGYSPTEGHQLLLLDLTVTNTFGEEITMFYNDFWLEWGGGDDEYTDAVQNFTGTLLADEYSLADKESVTGKMLFEIPNNKTFFALAYLEVWDDDSTGRAYYVDFELPRLTGLHTIGQPVSTVFFDFTVNSASAVADYEGYKAPVGKSLLLADVTITNTFGEEIPMYFDDFWVEWGTGDDEWTYALENFSDTLIADEFDLADGETVTGKLLFEVAEGTTSFAFGYIEIWDDGSTSDIFYVDFDLTAGGAGRQV